MSMGTTDTTGDPVRILHAFGPDSPDASDHLPEWLIGNGLGGYACGTVPGVLARRYHGMLIAALRVPLGRTVMLNLVLETVRLDDGQCLQLGTQPISVDGAHVACADLAEFRLELGLPTWRFQIDGLTVERRAVLAYGQNTAVISWRLEGADAVTLEVRPFLHFRGHDASVSDDEGGVYRLSAVGDHYEICAGDALPPLRLVLRGETVSLTLDGGRRHEVSYATEARRGYDWRGTLWSPGRFCVRLERDHHTWLAASTEPWERLAGMRLTDALHDEQARRRALIERAHPSLRESPADELVLAADAFVIDPPREHGAPSHGNVANRAPNRTIIAGYHWFTDWGRDTMISLEGLTLLTGRQAVARSILLTFAENVRDGLIPNFFSEHEGEGVYHTADATLWFFHALDRYVDLSGDRELVRMLLPRLIDIIEHHSRGTHFGIGVDAHDGLLRQGADAYQLTWMDAKVADWVVTPRRGKAVEINALWYNALCVSARWVREFQYTGEAPPLLDMAEAARRSFNARFWYEGGGYLYDVVDGEHGDDPSCRPNQVFALSLPHPVLDPARWEPVMSVVEQRLLTPVGLRSLSADHPDYKPQYHGDLRARDAAYHQGTVWAWLIGPFVDAWLKVHPDRRGEARRFLDGFSAHLNEACVGSISEIFDAEPPFAPRGCVAQAWSVAEVLRAWRNSAA